MFESSILVFITLRKEPGRRLEGLDLPNDMTKFAGEVLTTLMEKGCNEADDGARQHRHAVISQAGNIITRRAGVCR